MITLFSGPTLSRQDIAKHIDCVCYPPVSHGDILRLLKDKPTAIGIIDGYFEGAPSVWHKEILYAMDQGIHVYGSSSMGALRAAELHPFGMIGVGKIFKWYRDGIINDDDEVAVLHGPAEMQFAVASEPLVNIRATLALAVEQGAISELQKNALITTAKNTFYKKRSWNQLLENSNKQFTDASSRSRFRQWLDENALDLKKSDAIELLKTIQGHQQSSVKSAQTQYHFEWTNVWDNAFNEHTGSPEPTPQLDDNGHKVLDQLRLDPIQFKRYQDKALLVWACDPENNLPSADVDLKATLKQFKADNQLASTTDVLTHIKKIDLDEAQFIDLLTQAGRVNQALKVAPDLKSRMLRLLKLDGHYLDLLNTANIKAQALESAGLNPDDPGVVPPKLLDWYFVQQLGIPIPQPVDGFLRTLDLDNKTDFYRLIAADYLYCGLNNN